MPVSDQVWGDGSGIQDIPQILDSSLLPNGDGNLFYILYEFVRIPAKPRTKNNMKIAFLVFQFPSLSQTFVLNQITGLIDRGHDVEIFASNAGRDTKVHQDVVKYDLLKRTHYRITVPVKRFSRLVKGIVLFLKYFPKHSAAILNSLNFFKYGKKAASLYLLFQIVPFLNKGPFDIIHCHFGQNGNLAVLLREAGVLSGKIITTFHGFDITSYIKKNGKQIYKNLFAKGDLFQPISKRWEKRLVDLGCKKEKISVHRMGIDLDKIRFSPYSDNKNGSVKIVSVARLVEKKGIHFGIQAIANLTKNYPNIEYSIIGDGPLKEDLQDLVNQLKLSQKIRFMGWMNQEETFEIMQRSDIFLAPSVTSKTGEQEGIPVVLMEAMAHGLPVVSTYHSGIPELVMNNKTGFLVDEKDSDALAKKLEVLISNPEILKKFGIEGRKAVEKDYNIQLLNDNLAKTYHELIHRSF